MTSPTPTVDRYRHLDTLRGFALLGILLVNMQDYSTPTEAGQATLWNTTLDTFVSSLLRFATEGKFRAIFSFLFGLGFALQMQRAHDPDVLKRYKRRLIILLGMGLAHYIFVWDADILTTYALVGFLLLPFASCSVRTALRAAGAFGGVAVLLLSVIVLVAHPRPKAPPTTPTIVVHTRSETVRVLSEGSYKEVVIHRAKQIGVFLGRNVPLAPLTLMLFLLGVSAGKSELIKAPCSYRSFLRKVLIGGFCCGVLMNGLVTVYASDLMSLPKVARLPIVFSYVLGGPILGISYLAGLSLLLLNPKWQALLHGLASVGRMTLTNYLTQSLFCTTFYYGYGFGWYNSVRPVIQVGLCLLLFSLQAAISVLWLRYYRYGPVEWFWRSLTYGKRLPLLID